MAVELKVPSAGESITEVMIVEWRKSEGEYVAADETLVEIETDKASMEVPAPVGGIVKKQLKEAGSTAGVGETIAEIEEAEAPKDQAGAKPSSDQPEESAPVKGEKKDDGSAAAKSDDNGEPRVMPAAQRVLTEHGLTATEVEATGPGGRLLKEDVERHVAQAQSGGDGRKSAEAGGSRGGDRQEEVVPMTMLRRRIAERLVEAQHNAAMLTTFNEADMSAVMQMRGEYKDEFERKHGVKLGFMSFFVKAAIDALKAFPAVNAEIRGTDIVYKNYYDIGVAVGTERGLVVPVVRNAERLSFAEIEIAIGQLAARARDRKLSVEELQGGTFTISNGGIYGSMLSTPILNPPQSGILGLHNIQKRPIADGDAVVVRPMMYLALSYDHRIVDGKEAVSFLRRIKECIESPARMLVEI